MNKRVVSNVTEFIDAIYQTSRESNILSQQIENANEMKKQNDSESGLSDYLEKVIKTKRTQTSNPNYESTSTAYKFFYRGQYSTAYKLLPSVFRGQNWNNEDYFYHEIMVQCPNHFAHATHLDKLVTMQHYECPTRLLDVTANPLVALYFACKNYGCHSCHNSNEGEVYIFPVRNNEIAYSDSDRALMLSCLARFSEQEKQKLYQETINAINSSKYTQVSGGSRYKEEIVEKFFHEISTEVPSFKREIKPLDILTPLFVQPNKTNARIVKQDGAFIINGLSSSATEAESKLKTISHSSIIVKNQSRVLRELELLGIHEASLFPEVDKVAQYLKNKQYI